MAFVTEKFEDIAKFKPHHSYSQDGEDMLLRHLLTEQIPNYNSYRGWFVDIGAYHPYRHSNTMHYYELGWQGINIEPTAEHLELFNKYRNRDINLNIGIGEQEEMRELYCFEDPSLNTFDKDVASARVNGNRTQQIIKTDWVKIVPLSKVLDAYLPAGVNIDFMSFDVAGLDIHILKSNNWTQYRPKFVLVEDVDSNLEHLDASEQHDFLTSKGYELVSKTLRTLIYQQKRQV
ncbi:hypothetical protein GCM10027037_19920 [Mucilaginibacter koreensis]